MAAPHFDPADVNKNRVVGGIGYLLFFVPLIACNNSRYGRYCANQGLLLLIAVAVVSIVFGLLGAIPLIGWLFNIIRNLVQLVIAVVAVYYTFLAVTAGDAREYPIIGYITIIR